MLNKQGEDQLYEARVIKYVPISWENTRNSRVTNCKQINFSSRRKKKEATKSLVEKKLMIETLLPVS